jgi:hypothetical protein
MIELFAGKLGGGKSLHAVKRMLEQMAQGGYCASNIDLDFTEEDGAKSWDKCVAYCAKRFNVLIERRQYQHLSDDELTNFHEHTFRGSAEFPALIVVDEAHLGANARDYRKKDKNERGLLEFLTQSRKDDTDIIFITQHDANLDAQYNRQVAFIWTFQNMRDMMRVPVLGIKWPLKQVLITQYKHDGYKIGSNLVFFDKGVFGCYDTKQMFKPIERKGSFKQLKLKPAREPKQQAQANMKYIAAILIGTLVIFGLFRLLGSSDDEGGGIVESVLPGSSGGDEDEAPAIASAFSPGRGADRRREMMSKASPADDYTRNLIEDYVTVLEHRKPIDRGTYIETKEAYRAQFINHQGREVLMTEFGTYKVGETSPLGECVRIERRAAKILGFDGQWFIVRAYDDKNERKAYRATVKRLERIAALGTIGKKREDRLAKADKEE